MRKQLIILLSALISIQAYSQIIFEDGYFIDESDQNIECLIKNVDWKNNPKGFEYKLSSDGATQYADIQTVKEFGITGSSKYVRATVDIDRSSSSIQNMNSSRSPDFTSEQLFLKILIEGKASLYNYNDRNLIRYFYKMEDSDNINQLIYKKYKVNNQVNENNLYKQQLINDLACFDISKKEVENINYKQKELKLFFIKYNECTSADYIDFEKNKNKKDLFSLSLRPGLNYSHLKFQELAGNKRNWDLRKELSFRFGVETEFIFPFNKDKWSIILEPTYQYYKSTHPYEYGTNYMWKINYKSIEIPVGIRHYFFLNNDSKIFINSSIIIDLPLNSTMEQSNNDSLVRSLEIRSRTNFALGAGLKYKNRYSIEMRYQTGREILNWYQYWSSNYQTMSLNLGYTIF